MVSEVREGFEDRGVGREGSYLVYHVCDQAFHLVVVLACRRGTHVHVHVPAVHATTPRLTESDRRGEILDVNPRVPLPFFVQIPGQVHLPEQVPQTDVPSSLQSEVDAPFDELVLPFRESGVEGRKRADADGEREGSEEGAEARVGRQETGRG